LHSRGPPSGGSAAPMAPSGGPGSAGTPWMGEGPAGVWVVKGVRAYHIEAARRVESTIFPDCWKLRREVTINGKPCTVDNPGDARPSPRSQSLGQWRRTSPYPHRYPLTGTEGAGGARGWVRRVPGDGVRVVCEYALSLGRAGRGGGGGASIGRGGGLKLYERNVTFCS